MHRFERCQSTVMAIEGAPGRAAWSLEQFWEQNVPKGQETFFTTCITMSPASGRQKESQFFVIEIIFRDVDASGVVS